jgi:GT2 family glycosyltransferase
MTGHMDNTTISTNLKTELVIPSYNRIDILLGTLKSVRILYPDLKICIGLQGDKPTNRDEETLQNYRHLRIETLAEPSTTRTLNHCIQSSAADVILILDDDAVPHFGWLETHLSAFTSDPGLTYTCGREIRFRAGRAIYSDVVRIIVELISRLFLKKGITINGRIVGWTSSLGLIFGNFDQPGSCIINSPRGCNMAIRKDTFIKMGGFKDIFRGNAWGFEADFGLRMAKAGIYGLYVGDAIVIHYEASSGGSRQAIKLQWFSDYLHNNKILISNLGIQAWLGALPRLIKKRFFK